MSYPSDRSNSQERVPIDTRPLLMVDIDGVLSLFGPAAPGDDPARPRSGSFHSIEGIPHFLSASAAAHLLDLHALYQLVWASGWEERADEHLPHLLGVPRDLPFLRFQRDLAGANKVRNAHWKLDAIDTYADGRALAWVDDALDEECHAWARARQAPTLLVQTEPEHGLTDREAELLKLWAQELPSG
jgi:hypothetical protein